MTDEPSVTLVVLGVTVAVGIITTGPGVILLILVLPLNLTLLLPNPFILNTITLLSERRVLIFRATGAMMTL